jgi:serine/threonine protein phosphatase PrpC
MAAYDEDTAEFKTEQAFSEHFFACYEPQLELRPAAATHVGKVRHRNEDHHAVIRHTRSRKVLFTNLPKEDLAFLEDEAYGMVVADGIGGAARGDLASRLALRTMFELAGRATSWVMKITDLDAQEIHQRVEAYVSEIQRTLRSYSDGDPELAEMGTTWTSAHVFGSNAVVVHIGDSRAYLYRDSQLQLITRDQTLGQEMADAGVPEEDVRRFRNILTNSLGGDREVVRAEVYQFAIQPGDRLLLCTDGLSDMVGDPRIADVLKSLPEPMSACNQLIERALDAGGKDNITVVICDVPGKSEPPES